MDTWKLRRSKRFFSSYVESHGEKFQLQRDIELELLRETLQRFGCNYNAVDISKELFSYRMKPTIFHDTLQFLDIIKIPTVDLKSAVCHHSIKATSIVTSEDVRSYKPRPEIFLRAMELMGVRPEEVFHIGDS